LFQAAEKEMSAVGFGLLDQQGVLQRPLHRLVPRSGPDWRPRSNRPECLWPCCRPGSWRPAAGRFPMVSGTR
jgi:hypothetical protein